MAHWHQSTAEEDDVGLFFRPRRPLARLAAGAATAGIADHAGQPRAQRDVDNQQAVATSEVTQAPPSPAPTDTMTPCGRPSPATRP